MHRTTTPVIAGLLTAGLSLATASAEAVQPSADAEWVVPLRAAKKKNPVAADAASLTKGQALYVKECLSCHGPAGKGDGPAVKDLEKKPGDLSAAALGGQSDGALFFKITEGRKPMPAMEKIFTEEERWHVINYVRTLAPKPANPTPATEK